MIKEDNVRISITMKKESLDCISIFAKQLKLSKSEFIECVCIKHIQDVCIAQERKRQLAKKNAKKGLKA